jgi:hypothetical protein
MPKPALRVLLVIAGLIAGPVMPAPAQEAEEIAQGLNERVLFVTSGGYWEELVENQSDPSGVPGSSASEPGEAGADAPAEAVEEPQSGTEAPRSGTRRGYYRLVAIRGEDNRSLVDLQRIALTPEGPQLVLSISLEEINALGAYVTDIRPENSTGAASEPGFSAFIYLKTDPAVTEPETWALFVDTFGDIVVEKSSN